MARIITLEWIPVNRLTAHRRTIEKRNLPTAILRRFLTCSVVQNTVHKHSVAIERLPDSDTPFDVPYNLSMRKRAGGPMSSGWPVYDNETQYRQIVAYLLPGETLYAVYDCKGIGTGFVGITDRRLIFYDQGIIAKKRMMVSLPYQNILGVAVADEGMIFQSGEIIILTAFGRFEFEFRGSDRADWIYRFLLGQILAPRSSTSPTGYGS